MINFKLGRILSPNWMIFGSLALFAAFMINKNIKSKPCESACINKGYVDFRHTSAGRYGYPPEACFCLTQEQSEHKNRFYLGTKIKP